MDDGDEGNDEDDLDDEDDHQDDDNDDDEEEDNDDDHHVVDEDDDTKFDNPFLPGPREYPPFPPPFQNKKDSFFHSLTPTLPTCTRINLRRKLGPQYC